MSCPHRSHGTGYCVLKTLLFTGRSLRPILSFDARDEACPRKRDLAGERIAVLRDAGGRAVRAENALAAVRADRRSLAVILVDAHPPRGEEHRIDPLANERTGVCVQTWRVAVVG